MANRYFQGTVPLFVVSWLMLAFTSLASAQWNEQVLYSFQGNADGYTPTGGIVFDKAGNLYGATTDGGADNCSPVANCGTVFQLTRPAKDGDPWAETVLYVFKGAKYGDGDLPGGGLVIDSQGNLYGTTTYGGTGNCVFLGINGGCGTVYKLSPPAQEGGAWTETVLYSFPTAVQGYAPQGDLIFDGKGNLYGATLFGGGYGTTCNPYYQYCGAIFELSPPQQKGGAWTETVLHGFMGTPPACCDGSAAWAVGDGASPNGGLAFDISGNLYGTTNQGGNATGLCNGGVGGTGCGTVFELSPPRVPGGPWTERVLHRFDMTDGAGPQSGVTIDNTGRLYGTTSGTVFLLTPRGKSGLWIQTILAELNQNVGYDPEGNLIFDAAGNLYGTASVGGRGAVFSLRLADAAPDSWVFTDLYNFGNVPDGEQPDGRLTSDGAGNLYGVTQYGGSGSGCSFTGAEWCLRYRRKESEETEIQRAYEVRKSGVRRVTCYGQQDRNQREDI